MIKASALRNKEQLKSISSLPGYYKWWVSNTELDVILKALNVSYSEIEKALEIKDELFCVYVGIAAKESVRERLNWHINDRHNESRVINGTLSTLRQSIASIVSKNQFDKTATDLFIDKMYVEWFYISTPIKSEATITELNLIETNLMSEYLRILNIKDNPHPLSVLTKSPLKRLRKESKRGY